MIVVTGASSGIGRATARAFGAQGASLGLLARGRDGLEAARREVEAAGGRAIVQIVDVADAEAVEAAAAAVEGELGPIDAWVNVAMATVLAPVKDLTAAEIRRSTEVSYLGHVHGTLSALRRMLPRDRGTIVQVNSALACRGVPLLAGLLRRQARDQGLHRVAACRAVARRQRREGGAGPTTCSLRCRATTAPAAR